MAPPSQRKHQLLKGLWHLSTGYHVALNSQRFDDIRKASMTPTIAMRRELRDTVREYYCRLATYSLRAGAPLIIPDDADSDHP
jgi:hypothetical protein